MKLKCRWRLIALIARHGNSPFTNLCTMRQNFRPIWIELKRELKDTNYELDNERENNDDLRKQLQQKNADSLSTEIQYLQSLYRPTTREFASIGLAIILSGALGVMTQMEKVSVILEKYSPFAKHYISTGLF